MLDVKSKRIGPGNYEVTNQHGDIFEVSRCDGENGDPGEWVIYGQNTVYGVTMTGDYHEHVRSYREAKEQIAQYPPQN